MISREICELCPPNEVKVGRLVGWLDTLGRTVLPMGAAAVKVAKSTVMSEGARSRSQGK